MTTPSRAVPESSLPSPLAERATLSEARPMYWSIRRELWEHRSIYLAPLAVAALVLFGSLIGLISLPSRMRALPTLDPAKQHLAVVSGPSVVPAPIILVTFIVGVFYCLDALNGERRDRSILFWKSMPVSDRTTVLSKAGIPLVVMPLIAIVLGQAAQLIVLLSSTAILLASDVGAARLWSEFRFFQEPLVLVYGVTVHALWYAPIYAWLLMVSAWSRRSPFLWAVLPPLAIAAVERIAFNTRHLGALLRYRLMGAMTEAFAVEAPGGGDGIIDELSQLDPGRFLGSPGLWLGLVAAAAFLAAAARLRRHREPI